MKPLYRPLAFGFSLLCVSFLACMAIGRFCYNENVIGWIPCVLITFFLAFICFNGPQSSPVVFRRSLLLTTALLWVNATLIGMLPYALVHDCNFSTSLFESASGLTTTGSSALSQLKDVPKSLLLWRSLSQWLGGLGLVIFFIPFLSKTAQHKKLFFQETSFTEDETSLFSLRKRMVSILGIYIMLTLLCFGLLLHYKLPCFEAICHTLAGVSTGGFSCCDGGLPSLHNTSSEIVLFIFMFFGGINFMFLSQIFSKTGPSLIDDYEFRAYVCILLFGTLFVFVGLLRNNVFEDAYHALWHAAFQVMSMVTTSGWHSCDYTAWPAAILTFMLGIMLVGGCSGSTAGGLKLFRVLALFKILTAQFEKNFHPSIVRSVRFNQRAWDESGQMKILLFFTLSIWILFFGTFALQLLMPSLDFLTALSTCVAHLSNVGPGITATVGPLQTYSAFSPSAKILLSMLMLIGRLELYAILVFCSVRFWKKFE